MHVACGETNTASPSFHEARTNFIVKCDQPESFGTVWQRRATPVQFPVLGFGNLQHSGRTTQLLNPAKGTLQMHYQKLNTASWAVFLYLFVLLVVM